MNTLPLYTYDYLLCGLCPAYIHYSSCTLISCGCMCHDRHRCTYSPGCITRGRPQTLQPVMSSLGLVPLNHRVNSPGHSKCGNRISWPCYAARTKSPKSKSLVSLNLATPFLGHVLRKTTTACFQLYIQIL